MAKRVTQKRSAAVLLDAIRKNAEVAESKKFCDASTQTKRAEKDTSADASDSSDAKLNKCLALLAHANAKLDALGSAGSSQCQHECQAVGVKKLPMDPVKDLRGLKLLEENSEKEEFVKSVITSIGQLHGRQRYIGKGGSVCLQIMDYFFDRQFLLECSWTGTGRKSSEQEQMVQKIPFCKFKGVIKLFYQTVLQSDPEFTMDECKSFLHRCLRNAKQRFEELGGIRKPAARKRKLREHNQQEEANEVVIEQDEVTEPSVLYVQELEEFEGAQKVWNVKYVQ